MVIRDQTELSYVVNGSMRKGRSNRAGEALHVTLRFGEGRLRRTIAGITCVDIWVGIESAFVNFKLHKCAMPDGDWLINPDFERSTVISYKIGEKEQTVTSQSRTQKLSANATVSPSPLTAGAERGTDSREEDRCSSSSEKSFNSVKHRIYPRGSSLKPSWQLTAAPGESVLRGTVLDDCRFAQIQREGAKSKIDLELEVPKHAVTVRDATGNMQKLANKWGLARILLSNVLCKKPLLLDSITMDDPDAPPRKA
jgi:hypothetical protein